MKALITALALLVSVAANAENIFTGVESSLFGDGYYTYNVNNPIATTPPGQPTYSRNGYRAYDDVNNALTVGLVGLTINKKMKDFSFYSEFNFAHTPTVAFGTNLTQGYLSFAPNAMSGWVVEVGQFLSHMGHESYHTQDNWNYSRSLSYTYGGPTWHTGARFLGPAHGNFTANFYLLNGAGDPANPTGDNNHSKTVGAQVVWDQSSGHKYTYNLDYGPEKANNNGDQRIIHNLIAEVAVAPKIDFVGELVLGSEENQHADTVAVDGSSDKSKWTGITLAGKYQVSDKIYFSPRFEIYKAEQYSGMLGLAATAPTVKDEQVKSLTLTLGQKLGQGLDAKYEFRHDKSDNDNAFLDGATSRKDSQTTLTVALLFAI